MAAIAACHATARTAAETDWVEIALLYERLFQMVPSPVVALNRAVAVAMADGPRAGLVEIEQLERGGGLAGYYLLPASRADLLRRLGHHEEARIAYADAIEQAPTDVERRYLERRLAEVSVAAGGLDRRRPGPGL
jgi:RNA polymerase sigma-70 factor (ECF subfamily)